MADANTGTGDRAANGSFSEQRLMEKFDKLNNSAASIQTLSQWCIFHRKRARRVVDTWEKQFVSATNDKKVSYLYLSNDILQNSKRKGGEYVNEFWRVLPRSLKHVYENGEEGKKVVARLIGIWDERKVFGTCIKSLKVDILGDSLPTLDSNGKNSNPSSNPSSNFKSARKESSTIIKKLTVGGMPEKIVTAYQSVLDKHFDEDTALNKCKSTVDDLEKTNKDVYDACIHGIQQGSSLISDLQEQETTLKQCIEQLESVNTARETLINQLKEALSEQESKAELICSQLQVAQADAAHVSQLRQHLGVAPIINGAGSSSGLIMNAPPSEQTSVMIQSSGVRPISPQLQPPHAATSVPVPATVSVVGDEPKKAAAAMADKLASLSAPEEVLFSVFGSLAAQHVASINSASPSGELTAGPPGFQLEKRPRIEPTQASDMGTPFFGQVPQVQQQIGGVPTSVGGTQPPTPANQAPGSFPPIPPPLPSLLPPLLQQFAPNTGGAIGRAIGMGPFSMMGGSMPPAPPLSNIMPAGFPRPSGPPAPPPLPQAQTQPQPQSPQAPQQSSASAGFFQSSGIGFFPPVQVQQSPSVQRQ